MSRKKTVEQKEKKAILRRKRRTASCDEDVIKLIAAQMQLPVAMIYDVVMNGQAKFTAATMKSNNFEGVRWPAFGVFKIKPKSLIVSKFMKGLSPAWRKLFRRKVKLIGFWPKFTYNAKGEKIPIVNPKPNKDVRDETSK